MARNEMLRQAAELEQQAATNDAYAAEMDRTAECTDGRLGSMNAPNAYAAHLASAERKRLRALELRTAAETA